MLTPLGVSARSVHASATLLTGGGIARPRGDPARFDPAGVRSEESATMWAIKPDFGANDEDPSLDSATHLGCSAPFSRPPEGSGRPLRRRYRGGLYPRSR